MTSRPGALAIVAEPSLMAAPAGFSSPARTRAMLAHAVAQARAANSVDDVLVVACDQATEATARELGAAVVRSDHPHAATLDHLLSRVPDWCRTRGVAVPECVVVLSATAPLYRPDHIDAAIAMLIEQNLDRLVSVDADSSLPVWACEPGQPPVPVAARRLLRENGAIRVGRLSHAPAAGPARVGVYEMDFPVLSGVNSAVGLALVECVLQHRPHAVRQELPERVALVVFDFDGVMTENGLWVDQEGKEAVRCDRSDGLGIAAMNAVGVPMMVLSTETNPVVACRCEKLRLTCEQGVGDKAARLAVILRERGIDPATVVYLGNDTNDLGCLRLVGFPVLVSDAHPDVAGYARLTLSRPGGRGAVREFCDMLLEGVREGRIAVIRP